MHCIFVASLANQGKQTFYVQIINFPRKQSLHYIQKSSQTNACSTTIKKRKKKKATERNLLKEISSPSKAGVCIEMFVFQNPQFAAEQLGRTLDLKASVRM